MKFIISIIDAYSWPVTIVAIVAVFAVSLGLGLVSGENLRYPDEREYSELAVTLVQGKGFVDCEGRPTAYRPPGWPYIISLLYRLWPSPLAAKVFNSMAYAFTAFGLSILVGRLAPAGRVFAPLLLLFYPLGIYTASTLYPQAIGMALLVAIVALLTCRKESIAVAGYAGILSGLLALTIPSHLLVIPLIICGMILTNRGTLSVQLYRSTLFILLSVMVVCPWTMRNHLVVGKFIPVSTNSGVNLLLGNSENTGPNSGVNVDVSRYIEQVKGLEEAETDARYRKFAIEWVLRNPREASILYLRKVLNYFNFRNELLVKTEASPLRNAIIFITYYPLLLIAVVRLWMYRGDRICPDEWFLYFLYFGNALVSAVFFTRMRFRMPFDALLVAIVAIMIGRMMSTIRRRLDESTSRGNAA